MNQRQAIRKARELYGPQGDAWIGFEPDRKQRGIFLSAYCIGVTMRVNGISMRAACLTSRVSYEECFAKAEAAAKNGGQS